MKMVGLKAVNHDEGSLSEEGLWGGWRYLMDDHPNFFCYSFGSARMWQCNHSRVKECIERSVKLCCVIK